MVKWRCSAVLLLLSVLVLANAGPAAASHSYAWSSCCAEADRCCGPVRAAGSHLIPAAEPRTPERCPSAACPTCPECFTLRTLILVALASLLTGYVGSLIFGTWPYDRARVRQRVDEAFTGRISEAEGSGNTAGASLLRTTYAQLLAILRGENAIN